jgi:hypothetical protein
VARIRAVVADELVGVYASGSYALGAYESGRSDIDVVAVVQTRASQRLKEALVEAIRHESLPCPARGLEFVLYTLEATSEPSAAAAFELNLNTGADMVFRADFEPDPSEEHWFSIDRAILARDGIALAGPPAGEVFAPIPKQTLLPVLVESLRWHGRGLGRGDDAVLNACRSLRFAVEGVWSSKPEAGRWAAGRVPESGLVRSALAARTENDSLDPEAVTAFVAAVAARVAREGTSG